MRPRVWVLAVVGLLLAALATRAGGGTTGGISGYVRYADGNPGSGLVVWVCSATQVAVGKTDSAGFYSFVSLAPGIYSMHIVSRATYPASIEGIRVTADDTTTQDSHVCPLIKICGDSFSLTRPLRMGTSADVGNFDADDADRSEACGFAW